MSTAVGRLIIVASMAGDKLIKKQMDDMGKKADTTALSLRSMGTALLGIGFGVAAARLIQYSDALTAAQNKMKLLTTSTGESSAYMQGLYQIAQDTRSEFGATVTIFQRVALALKSVGGTAGDAAQFTKTLGQAIQLSGATAQEANAAMIQLSQGLAKGKLNGDELRSVLEQLPLVGRLIAKEMGKDFGELRDLGAAGMITTQVVVNAIKNASADIEEAFDRMTPTMGSALTVLNNGLMYYFGNLMNGTGISSLFASVLITIGRHMEIFGAIITGVVVPGLMLLARMALPYVVAGINATAAAIRAHPFFFLASILISIVTTLYMLSDAITLTIGGETRTLMDWFWVAWASIKDILMTMLPTVQALGASFMNFLASAWSGISPLLAAFGQLLWYVGGGLFHAFQILASIAVPILSVITQSATFLANVFSSMISALVGWGEGFRDFFMGIIDTIYEYAVWLIDTILQKLDELTGYLFELSRFSSSGGSSYDVVGAIRQGVDTSRVPEGIKIGFKDTKTGLDKLFGAMGDIKSAIEDSGDETKAELKATNNFMPQIINGQDIWGQGAVDATNQAKNGIMTSNYQAANDITSTMSGLLSSIQSTLRNISQTSAKTAAATTTMANDSGSLVGTTITSSQQNFDRDQMAAQRDAMLAFGDRVKEEGSQILLANKLDALLAAGQIDADKATAAAQEGNKILEDYFKGNLLAYNDLMKNGDENFKALINSIIAMGEKQYFDAVKSVYGDLGIQYNKYGEDRYSLTDDQWLDFNGGLQEGGFFNTIDWAAWNESLVDQWGQALQYTGNTADRWKDPFKLFDDIIVDNPIIDAVNDNTNAVIANTQQIDQMEKLYNKLNLARQNISEQYGTLDSGTLLGGLPGFANGGSAYVPGGGAPDSVPFMAMLSPGERIEFTPRRHQGGESGGGDTVQIQVNLNGSGAVKEYRQSQAAVDRAIAASVKRARRAARQ